MEAKITNYILAKTDIDRGDFPHRDANRGVFHFTLGQRKILAKFRERLDLNNQTLNEKSDRLTYLKQFSQDLCRQAVHSVDEIKLEMLSREAQLDESNAQLASAQEDIDKFKADLASRGITLGNVVEPIEQSDCSKPVTSDEPAQNQRNSNFRVSLTIALVEVVILTIQYQALRQFLSIEEVVGRLLQVIVLSIFVQMGGNRLKGTRSLVWWFFFFTAVLMLAVSMLGPPLVELGYPQNYTQDISFSNSLSEQTAPLAQHNAPLLIEFYRSSTWIPLVICLIFFIVATYVPSRASAEKSDVRQPVREKEADSGSELPKSELRRLMDILKGEERKNHNIQQEISKLTNQSAEIKIAYESKSEDIVEQVQKIDSDIKALRIELANTFSSIEDALSEYEAEYKYLVSTSKFNPSLLGLSWPQRADIHNFFTKK